MEHTTQMRQSSIAPSKSFEHYLIAFYDASLSLLRDYFFDTWTRKCPGPVIETEQSDTDFSILHHLNITIESIDKQDV